jgi:hypothetical protein
LSFYASNKEVAYINSSKFYITKNVGIKTNSPSEALHVVGNIYNAGHFVSKNGSNGIVAINC